jgi:hypothetical protein
MSDTPADTSPAHADAIEKLETLLNNSDTTTDEPKIRFVKACKDVKGEKLVYCDPMDTDGKYACPPSDRLNKWSKVHTYTKNPNDKDALYVGMCVPPYMRGAAGSKRRSSKTLNKRLAAVMDNLSTKLPEMARKSAFQWETPCQDNTNYNQCYIMKRDESSKHGSRCYWVPSEDPNYDPDAMDGPLCRPVDDLKFKRAPLTAASQATINDNLASHSLIDDGSYIASLNTP